MSLNQGAVINPASTNLPDGSNPPGGMGRQGEQLASELHGKYYTAAYRGNVFTTSVPAAGSLTLPTTLATLASKFCLLNPSGSAKNFELIRLDYFINSATEVVNTLGITKSTQVAAGLGTLTAGVVNNTNINGGLASQALFYVAATHTDTPVWYKSLLGVNATAVGYFQSRYDFDGSVILPPGNCIDLVMSIAAQANSLPDLMWAEWPV
jgi:hypothetical protein